MLVARVAKLPTGTTMPSKSGSTSADPTVGTRLSSVDLRRLDNAANAAGIDRSEFIRRAIKGRVIKFYPIEQILAEAIALLAALRRQAMHDTETVDVSLRRVAALVNRLIEIESKPKR
jgi:Ribbon-helix-helix protein, copG family